MFRIGEFSKLTQVSVRMLRHYDEVGLLRPAQIDEATGYRLYSVQQIPAVQKIVLLRNVGFGIAEIAAALADWDGQSITQRLVNKAREIEEAIRLEREHVARIAAAIDDLQTGRIAVHYNVTIRSIPSYQILSLRRTIPDYHCEAILWDELCAFVNRERVELHPRGGTIAFFHDDEHSDSDVDVEVGVIVSKPGDNKDGFVYRETEKVDTMACIMVYGPFENIGPSYQSFAYWLEKHRHYTMHGPVRQICHRGPFNAQNPDDYLTEVQVPVTKRLRDVVP